MIPARMRWVKVQSQVGHGRAEVERVLPGDEISGPGKRWGHTCNAIKAGRFLYVFGGYGKDNCLSNQVHVFDTVKQTWSQPPIKGTPPVPRDSHSCTTIGDSLFVFGGTDGTNPLSDLQILDTSSHTWISPTLRGEGPEAREGHGAALVGKRLFIFGGEGKPSEDNDQIYYNDLHILNTETLAWISAATSGTPPSPRDSHACSSWKNKFIVVGGEDRHDYYLSDVHILDTDTLTWTEVKTFGQIMPPRAGHSTVAFGKNLFVFGGFSDAQNLHSDLYLLDVDFSNGLLVTSGSHLIPFSDSGLWTRVTTKGEGPSARFSLDGDCLDPLRSGVLVFFGGCNKYLEAVDDMYYLHTGIVRESQQRLEKLSLRKQLKLKCQEQNLNPFTETPMVCNVGTDVSQALSMVRYSQASMQTLPSNVYLPPPGKKTFQAKVIENSTNGVTIETVIDGKPFRGILFNSTTHGIPSISGSSRKRALGETSGATSDVVDSSNLTASKVTNQDVAAVDVVHARELASEELQRVAVTDPSSTELTMPDTTNPPKLQASSNQEHDQRNDVSVFVSENVKDDKAHDIEVQRDCQSSDTPKCDVPKDPGHSSPKQGGDPSS